jgi:type II secretory pathway pseudopilin PulG
MVVVLVVLGVVAALTLNLYRQQRQLQASDKLKATHLASLARAEEFYFNRHHRYGTLPELFGAKVIPEVLQDPVTNQPYPVYFSSLQDEWCAWAKLSATPDSYLVQVGSRTYNVSRPPDTIANCKPS